MKYSSLCSADVENGLVPDYTVVAVSCQESAFLVPDLSIRQHQLRLDHELGRNKELSFAVSVEIIPNSSLTTKEPRST